MTIIKALLIAALLGTTTMATGCVHTDYVNGKISGGRYDWNAN